jgi:diguanylate cyclase (GGDEF)-like protein
MSLIRKLEQRSKIFITVFAYLSALFFVLMGSGSTTVLFTFPLFFIPIAVMAWFAGERGAITLTVATALCVSGMDMFMNPQAPFILIALNSLSKLVLLLIFSALISRVKEAKVREIHLSKIDHLTGIPNRAAFYDLANNEIHRAKRYKHPFSVAYLDIDNFKLINYRLGYSAGDSLLSTIGQLIKKSVRDVDVVSRVGGDEFAILLPETSAEPSQLVVSRLRSRLIDTAKVHDWPVTFSFGVVTYDNPPASVEDMIKKASVLMYSAKDSGPNMIDQDIVDGKGL